MVSHLVSVTASHLNSPGLFSVYRPILKKLSVELSLLVLLFPSPPVPVPILWWLYLKPQLKWVSLSLQCSTAFLFSFSQAKFRYSSFFKHYLNVTLWSAVRTTSLTGQVRFFMTIISSARQAQICQSVYNSKSQDRFICSNGQILASCTIPSGLPSPPCHVQFYTFSELICCICT